MILVALGTQDKPFDRLLKAVDKEIEKGNIKEEVIVQAGSTKYETENMKVYDYIPMEEFDRLIKECDLIITHGGIGTILTSLTEGKVVIAASRLKKYKEHVNDHQIQIITKFSKEGYILELSDFDKLDEVLKKAKTFKPKKYVSNTHNMVELIENYIDSL